MFSSVEVLVDVGRALHAEVEVVIQTGKLLFRFARAFVFAGSPKNEQMVEVII